MARRAIPRLAGTGLNRLTSPRAAMPRSCQTSPTAYATGMDAS